MDYVMALTQAAQKAQNARRTQEIGLIVGAVGAVVMAVAGLLPLMRREGRGPAVAMLVGGLVLAIGLGVTVIGLHSV